MTDKLSERAEKLAKLILKTCIERSDNATYFSTVYHSGKASELIESLAADSANLARGVMQEQAAQECDRHAAFCKTEAENGGNVEHLLTRKAEAEYNAKLIRSLSPDAAQALAHHNATVFQDTLDDLKHDGSELVVGGKEPVRIFSEKELAAHDAEIKRLARLDEAKLHAHDGLGPYQLDGSGWTPEQLETHMRCCRDCQRIAALAESQPAPAKQENPLTRSERWDKCISYIEKTRTLDEAKHLASLDGFGANTSVWLTAFSKLLQRRPAPAKEDK